MAVDTLALGRERVLARCPGAQLKRTPMTFYVVDGNNELLSGYKTTAERAWTDALKFLMDAGR